MHKIKDKLMEELKRYEKQNDLSAGSLEVIHKLTDTIKNIDKIEMLEYGQDYSASYDNDSSYARRGRTYVRGYYRDEGQNNYYRDADDMVNKLRRMMNETRNDHERNALKRCIEVIENDF